MTYPLSPIILHYLITHSAIKGSFNLAQLYIRVLCSAYMFVICSKSGRALASKINLLTHYAKGILLLLIKILLKLLINLLLNKFPSRYCSLLRIIPYLALEEGSPLFKQIIHFTNTIYIIWPRDHSYIPAEVTVIDLPR